MARKKFYITTPIYYTNSFPHIGSAYTTILADVLARWHRLKDDNVFFLTGTDEHGQKIQETAEKQGVKPKEFVDKISNEFKQAFKQLNISNDNFIRTTDKVHEDDVKKTLQELWKKKYIYKGTYKSYYCVGCEQYLTESDIVEGKCPLHNREPELRKEEAYMFRLSKFQKKLISLIKSGKYNIRPINRRNEVISFIETGLKDISISRLKEKVYWGIELPFDKKHSCFVWVDAFWNYVTGLKEKNQFKKFWPPEVQLMAKDILRVHATIWPALLLATKNKLPKTLFIHGYFTVDGQKMSKSLGNVISPVDIVEKYGSESVRYYFFRNIAFGEDGDVSEKSLVERHNNELANKLGNLVSRVSALAEQYGLEKAKPIDTESLLKKVSTHLEKYELDRALAEIFSFIDLINTFIQDNKPWETHDKKVLYQASSAIKDASILLSPFLPETAEKISKVFNFEVSLKSLQAPLHITNIKKSPILFKKIDMTFPPFKQQEKAKSSTPAVVVKSPVQSSASKAPVQEGIANIVDFAHWETIDLRVAKIEKVEDIEGADKLYKLNISLGSEKRILCAGLKKFYSKQELAGKKCIVFANLAPRVMKGITSQGMILAAVSDDESSVIIINPEKDIKEGSKVR